MSFLDRLFGRKEESPNRSYDDHPRPGDRLRMSPNEQAVERYRYMLRTAPPDQIEAAHAEAFARLTPDQRQLALQQLSGDLPESERPASDDPRVMARAATRAEMRNPGSLPRMWSGGSMGMGGPGLGGMMVGGLISSMAGAFIGTSIANRFFSDPVNEQNFATENNGGESGINDPTALANNDVVGDSGADYAVETDPYGDPAGDFGGGDFDTGTDLMGGDF